MKLLCAVVLLCALKTAQCCSCHPDSFELTRNEAIINDYTWSPMVYTGRVVGASCNCATDNTLSCYEYTYDDSQGSPTVNVQINVTGFCGLEFASGALDMCANLNEALSVDTSTTPSPPTSEPVNLTALAEFGSCRNICPFETDQEFYLNNYCQYTIKLLDVLKPQPYNGEDTIKAFGPDTLTSCGNPFRRLHVGETYVAGIGGACNPIGQWSPLSEFSAEEVSLLQELAAGTQTTTDDGVTTTDDGGTTDFGAGGANVILPSLATLAITMLLILLI